MDVRNCKNCGKLFQYTGKSLCQECLKHLEDDFDVVKKYVRDHPNSNVAEVSEETGVSVSQIRQWIREERLLLSKASATCGIVCDKCGRPILTGKLCQECKNSVTRELTQAFVQPTQGGSEGFAARNGEKMRFLSKDRKE